MQGGQGSVPDHMAIAYSKRYCSVTYPSAAIANWQMSEMCISSAVRVLCPLFGTITGLFGVYVGFLCLLTVRTFQDHIIFLHKLNLTQNQDSNVPEQYGFLRNQVTSFSLNTLHNSHKIRLACSTTGRARRNSRNRAIKLLIVMRPTIYDFHNHNSLF